MSPRKYHRSRPAADDTRGRIVVAARELLASSGGVGGFTLDAIARRADVARMTIYYQFGSKAGLLEAVYDDLASRGQLDRLPGVFAQADPADALSAYIAAFARFWSSDRIVIRRLQGLAVLDPDVEQGMHARQQRRRRGLRVIVGRIAGTHGNPALAAIDDAVDLLFVLTSFETFDALAGDARTADDVTRMLQPLARVAVGLPPG